jgi:hypothetical protein
MMVRRLVLMLSMCAALLACGALTNYLLNPYGVWQPRLVDPVFRKPKDEHVALPYLVRKAHAHTLLVGSSRVAFGMRIDELEGIGVLNAGIRAATIPQSCAIVRTALDNDHFKLIIWGVDFFAFNENWKDQDREFQRRLAGGLGSWLEDTLLSLSALDDGWADVKRAIRGRAKLPVTATRTVPWPPELICNDFEVTRNLGLIATPAAEVERQLSDDVPGYLGYHLSNDFLDLFRHTALQARRQGIRVILFVPPMSEYELELIRQSGHWQTFQNWKRGLAAIGPLWDFSGYNHLAASDQFFMHVMHCKTAVGETILRLLTGGSLPPCHAISTIVADSAIRMDPSNVDQALALHDQMRASAEAARSRYADLAAAALAYQQQHMVHNRLLRRAEPAR